jgi:hypothetical protein
VDRFVSNTLRTLGIVVTAIFVILGCLVLLLAALCFGALASAGPRGQSQPTVVVIAAFALIAAAVLIAGGVSVIAVLSRGMVRGPAQPTTPYPLIPQPTSTPKSPEPSKSVSDEARIDQTLADLEAKARVVTPPIQPSTEPSKSATPLPHSRPVPAPRPIDVRHLSPASRTAIHQLAYAIVAKVFAEIALGIVGWYGALGVPRIGRVPFPVYRFGFIVWGLAAIAPHLVLLYALARRPGPRTFAYALVIPALHLLYGLFGHSALLIFILRPGQSLAPLLSIFPWLIDILVLYLAWKAIRRTGIEPNPERLIVASVVIFLYSSLLPLLAIYLNTISLPGRRFP